MWRRRQPAASTIAEYYLRHRGYEGSIPSTLGFLPASGEYLPSMTAAFGFLTNQSLASSKVADDQMTGVHLIRFLQDGSDRERGDDANMMVRRSMGSPIVLGPVNDLLGLAIIEGISVLPATGVGVRCAGSTNRMLHAPLQFPTTWNMRPFLFSVSAPRSSSSGSPLTMGRQRREADCWTPLGEGDRNYF
jgi:hypothetical protein